MPTNPQERVDRSAPQTRDPLLWPYPADSIWNTPRGAESHLVPAPLRADDLTVGSEEDILIIAPDAELRPVLRTTADWNAKATRCGAATSQVLIDGVPVPEGWTTEPDYTGSTPNHSAAIVMPDYTLLETQPLHACADSRLVSGHAGPWWRGSSIITGGTPDLIGRGSHGGSGLTAFGGTIRLGEWAPGSTIKHVLKITIDSAQMASVDGGFRWPADRADANQATAYQGRIPDLRMGALVSLPPHFDPATLATEPARILATALRDYGAYVVDSAGQSSVGIAVEWGPQGRVTEEFEDTWGYPLQGDLDDASGAQAAFLQDMEAIYAATVVVADNAGDNVGGAGDRLAPWAPPLGDVA